ncbi:DUF2169 domain-containing protein [Burkholderia ambifaria]|uniref:DUF2169 domain-containing protein n=1 Tax=Burkholderia ambifaria MEX-5 TaxID=396597 RepID=B1T2Q6_9BURK|nr:DUF2169 domain-containing protein [Burkholderia ambifaria]EDT42135.1 conserved hypothetical protein [Burkholderia ambifaria MEX-5]
MWRVDNWTPFVADRTWVRDPDGAEVWVVAVKATYSILPDGNVELAGEQLPLNHGPVPADGRAGLLYDTDLGPSKLATDVVLNGSAWAPNGEPVRTLRAGFQIGATSHFATVHGDRYWERKLWSWRPSEAAAFVSMPLVYERAFGGDTPELPPASRNPVGRGYVPDAEARVWLPNLESVTQPIRNRNDMPPTTGFGVLPAHWPARLQHGGTYDNAWRNTRHPLPPADLDPRFWQIAPPEQQVSSRLSGGEAVTLVNVTPPQFATSGRLTFRLPKVSLVCETRFYDGTREHSRPVIHTVILEPDQLRVCVVYHMALPCHEKVNLLEQTRVTMKQRPLDKGWLGIFGDVRSVAEASPESGTEQPA